MPAFRIFLSDKTDYVTSMAAGTTLLVAKQYFLGKWFTQSDETSLQCIAVEEA